MGPSKASIAGPQVKPIKSFERVCGAAVGFVGAKGWGEGSLAKVTLVAFRFVDCEEVEELKNAENANPFE
jgi:hypothetical protein